MRQVVQTMMLVAVVTAMAMSVQPDASIHVDRQAISQSAPKPTADAYPVQLAFGGDAAFQFFQPSGSLGYPFQLVSLGNWSEPRSYFDPQQYAPFGEMLPSKPATKPMSEPRQPASIDRSEKPKAESTPLRPKPPIVKPSIARIQFNAPVLAPMSHTLFCIHYPGECRVRKLVFRGGALKLTAQRWAELIRVNAKVNHAIIPERNTAGLAGEKWRISPKYGECGDYAVTKRHELLALGWPERALLLSEVVTSWGEHHLVLVVRTSDGDFVADSLSPKIRSWEKAPYQWVRIQSPSSPKFWSSIANAAA